MTLLTRLGLLLVFILILSFVASFFRRLGWGEIGLIAAIFSLAFVVEIVRFLVKQFLKGYRVK
jgi:hypothetical protein